MDVVHPPRITRILNVVRSMVMAIRDLAPGDPTGIPLHERYADVPLIRLVGNTSQI